MNRLTLIATLLFVTSPAAAQAPASAFLWKLADQTLARPAALGDGAASVFWNPATLANFEGTLAGIQLVRAPDVIGIDGLIAAVSQRLSPNLSVGLMVGRLDMRDIVRTTSSPISTLGTIPIYDQMAAVTVSGNLGPAALGVALRGHNSRFDLEQDNGITTDIGFIIKPTAKLKLAASTHLQPARIGRDRATEYLGAVQYQARRLTIGTDSVEIAVFYGFTSAANNRFDHTFATAVTLDGVLNVLVGVAREEGYGTAQFRPTVELSLALGRYLIGVARSEGLNGIGASYRVLFDLAIKP